MKNFLILAAALVLSACASVPETIVQVPTTARPQTPSAMPVAGNGSIFQIASYRPLFEDRRARMVGDTLTITINERSTAGKQAGSSASKTGSVAASAPNLFGLFGGLTGNLDASASTASKYEDKGVITAGNNFISTLSVTVVEVLPNGNMVVGGEKQVALDKGAEFVRFSGVVDPSTITAGNVVSSTKVADARIEYRTNARIDKADIMNMLARFFLSVIPL